MPSSIVTRLGNAPEEGIKAPCVVSTLVDISLSGPQTINTVSVVAGNRVLVRSQTDATENGIWVAANGAWERAPDFNQGDDVIDGILVMDAHTNAVWQAVFTGSYNPGTTSVTFALSAVDPATAQAAIQAAVDAQAAQTAAETAETNALAAQTAAETAETNAETAETNAVAARDAAQVAQAAAEAALDAFDDRFLGTKTSDPTLDNDGNPLIDGALYWNTTVNEMKVYDLGNTIWVTMPEFSVSAVTYENLNTNGDVGTGSTQVAAGDHTHSGVYEPADATILKDADIGVNVQAYDPDIATVAASQAEMEAGTETAARSMSPSDIKSAIEALGGGGTWELVDLGGTSNPWTPTAVNSKDFTWDESLYSRILIVAEGLVPATDGVSLRLRLGHTNGTVILSGTEDYGYIATGPSGGNFNLTDNGSGLNTFIITGWSGSAEGVVGSNNDEGISLDITLTGMGSIRSAPRVRIESTWLDASGAELISDVNGVVTDASGDSNQFDTARLFWSSGNFELQGNVYVYGLKRA